ncbi:MAG: hypothetical protein J7K89_01065 [Candidatus Cloacimonetes bacterium]|nr:hypothetical protein [Candidatus Cloacimonadota bacterium]
MKGHMSFTLFERELLHEFRSKINRAESIEGLKQLFTYTIAELFMKVFSDSNLEIATDAIQYDHQKKDKYLIKDELRKHEEFSQVWDHSDLPDIVRRFAETVDKHFLYLSKHTEKTNKKIRSV